MKQKIIPFAIAVVLATIFFGCKEDTIQSRNDKQILQFEGRLTNHTDCKTFQRAGLVVNSTDSSSCIEYSFDAGNHKLMLKHINAGFNCCPESLYCLVTLRSDTIVIDEHEKLQGCHCNCLFDLDIEINGIEPGKYYIKMIEPYCGDQEKLYFEVDFAVRPAGSYCVKRTGYPWGF